MRASQQGDTQAFEELVVRHRDKIYARAYTIMRSEEEAIDLSQEAWVKGWQKLAQFHGESSFGTWMTRIVINLCLDQVAPLKTAASRDPLRLLRRNRAGLKDRCLLWR